MSNKVVPQTYRQIIDKVIASVRPDFEENGIEEDVLVALQQSWEAKLAMSRVADFSSDARLGAYQKMLPPAEEPAAKNASLSVEASGSNKENGSSDSKPPLGSASSSKLPVKQPISQTPSAAADSNELNSDLDESEDDLLTDDDDPDDEDGNGASRDEGDVIIALYEKVQRVKNKWKITLKDGVISAEGKDYLFGKCQGDFEW